MLRHTKLIAIHAPALTRICCLPILTYPSTGGFTRLGDHRVKSTIVGLLLERAGETDDALYRRIGIFSCDRENFEEFTKVKLELEAMTSVDRLTIY